MEGRWPGAGAQMHILRGKRTQAVDANLSFSDGLTDYERQAGMRRVGVWRGALGGACPFAAPFVWRCLSGSAVAPFPHPPHRTGQADFLHPALGQDLTPSFACDAIGSF